MINLLQALILLLIPVILGFLTPYIRAWLKTSTARIAANTKNSAISDAVWRVEKIIDTCVVATNQIYVDALKKENAFTEAAQRSAYEQTRNAVLKIITDETVALLEDTVKNFAEWLDNKIEAAVNKAKG